MVLELVKTATGAAHVSLVKHHGRGLYTVLATGKDAYGKAVMRRYRAVVNDGKLDHLRGM